MAWLLVMAAATDAACAQDAAPAAGQRTAPSSFMINAFDVTGVTKLDQPTIERAVYPFEGPDRSADDVEKARKALQDAYAAKGYETVQVEIPNQPSDAFAQGVVQLLVIEAPVGRVRVVGAKYHSPEVVLKQTPSLVEGQPLDLKTFQTELAAANRFPDRAVTPSFKAGEVPGTIDVDLKVADSRPIHGSIEIDNDHSPNTEPLRLNATLRYADLWQAGHSVSLTYIVAPQDRKQTEVLSASYTAPILGSPWTLVLYGYKSNSNIAALGGVSVLGNGYQIGFRALYRLPGDKIAQTVTIGFDYKNFDQNIFVGTAQASKAPIEYIPIYGSYSLARITDTSDFEVTASITAGLRAIKKLGCFVIDPTTQKCPDGNDTDQFKNKDYNANENFVHANLEVAYSHALPKGFVAAAKGYAQIADSHLVTNEQFAIGGLQNIRGYFQSEGVGDDGYAGSLELRSPSFASHLPKIFDEARLFGFVEGGQVRIRQSLPDQTSSFSLVSVGGGARVNMFGHISSEISVGVPLIDGPSTHRGDIRALFTTKGEF